MRIVLDARKYYDYGIGTYIQNLVAQLESQVELVLIVAPSDAGRIQELSHVQQKINASRKYSFSELRSIAADANELHADIFHAPHYTVPFGLKMPCVTTIHDILHVRGTSYYSPLHRLYARAMIRHACHASRAIIVDSEFTKQELLEVFPLVGDRVHVIHLGISPRYFKKYSEDEINGFKKYHGIVKPVILYTGGLKPHKNLGVLISAFSQMKHHADYQLVFSGESITRHRSLWTFIRQQGIANNVVDTGRISSHELALAYQAASVVVLPSLYEGFGFSVLEAMASGTPAIGARAASIPEVMSDAGMLFDPHSPEELRIALEQVLEDTALRQKLVQRGLNHAATYSWKACTDQTLAIYKDVQ